MNNLSAEFKLTFPNFTLDTSLDIPMEGFTVIFGPSGCGKTTLLRCLSGLERSAEGFLKVGSEIWQDENRGIFLSASKRPIGYVFQDARLFSHLSVESNLQYGFKRSSYQNRSARFKKVIAIMGVKALLKRQPHQISGGEKQRVAVARVLLTNPRLLLMDEPLAALDVNRKQEILPYLQRLQTELGIPIFYVTHSLNEVLQLVKTMVLLDQGRVVAIGPVEKIFSHYKFKRHIGPSLIGGVLDAKVVGQDDEFKLTVLEFNGQTLYVPQQELSIGSSLRVHIHAGDIVLAVSPIQHQTSVLNVLPAKVMGLPPSRKEDYMADVKLDIGSPLLATITRKSLAQLNLQEGQTVFAHIKAIRMIHEFD